MSITESFARFIERETACLEQIDDLLEDLRTDIALLEALAADDDEEEATDNEM